MLKFKRAVFGVRETHCGNYEVIGASGRGTYSAVVVTNSAPSRIEKHLGYFDRVVDAKIACDEHEEVS